VNWAQAASLRQRGDWLDDIDFHFNNKYKTQYINISEW